MRIIIIIALIALITLIIITLIINNQKIYQRMVISDSVYWVYNNRSKSNKNCNVEYHR